MLDWRKTEPIGGRGGKPFVDDMIGVKRLVGFRVHHEKYIDAIQGLYWTDGGVEWGQKHGGNGGRVSEVIFAPDEHLIEVQVNAGDVVDGLLFVTNKRTYPHYGGGGGNWKRFSFDSLGGFLGSCASYLDSICFYYQGAESRAQSVGMNDQSTMGDRTAMGDRTPLDDRTMVGDNTMIGDNTLMGGNTGIGDNAMLGDRTALGGHSTVGGRNTLGDRNTLNDPNGLSGPNRNDSTGLGEPTGLNDPTGLDEPTGLNDRPRRNDRAGVDDPDRKI